MDASKPLSIYFLMPGKITAGRWRYHEHPIGVARLLFSSKKYLGLLRRENDVASLSLFQQKMARACY